MNGKQYQIQNGTLVDITPKIAALNGGKAYTGIDPVVIDNVNDTIALAEAYTPLGDTIYVATTGSDTNDGKTAATAVRTITKALEIARGVFAANSGATDLRTIYRLVDIRIAAGTYAGDLNTSGLRVQMTLLGNVTVNGDFFASSASACIITGNYAFSVNGQVLADGTTSLHFGCKTVNVAYSGTDNALVCGGGAFIYADTNCTSFTITATNAGRAIQSNSSSPIVLSPTVNIVANNIDSCVGVYEGGSVQFEGALNISGTGCVHLFDLNNKSYITLGSNFTASDIVTGMAISCYVGCTIKNYGIANFYSNTNEVAIVLTNNCSLMNYGSITVNGKSTAYANIYCGPNSTFMNYFGSSLTINSTVAHTSAVTIEGGTLWFDGSSSLSISGSYTGGIISCGINGIVVVAASVTVTNNATGARYHVNYGGQISTVGAGAYRLPGSADGWIDSVSYGYYS
jgi:hypothetical protein